MNFATSDKVAFSTSNWARANGGTYEVVFTDPTIEGEDKTVEIADLGLELSDFTFKDKDGKEVELFATDKLPANASTVTSVEMSTDAAGKLKDGVTYTATISVKNTSGAVVATSTINFTKELPAFPSAIVYPFTNILREDVLYVYPIATQSKDGGKYDMANVWHGVKADGKWTAALAGNVDFVQVLTEEQEKLQGEGKYPTVAYPVNEQNPSTIAVEAKYVNPDKEANALYLTELPMEVTYNYGNISYRQVNNVWTSEQAWAPTGESFSIVFRNYADDCVFDWTGDAPKLAYKGVVGNISEIKMDQLTVTDWYNDAVSLIADKEGKIAGGYITKVEVHFLTGANFDKVDEYYESTGIQTKPEDTTNKVPAYNYIGLEEKSAAAQPNDVPTKLQFVITDSFGYEVIKVMETPFTMTAKK